MTTPRLTADEIERLSAERDEALQIAEGPSTLKDLAAMAFERGVELARARDLLRRHWKVIEDAMPYIPGSSFVAGEIDALEAERRAYMEEKP